MKGVLLKSSLDGWSRSAVINTIAVFTITVLCCILLGLSSARAGGIATNLIFYQGDCTTSSRTDLLLHLLLNIVSTAVLASSTFFRQIICAPSRAEVDAAHARGKALTIGVPSISNLFFLSPFKGVCWLLFFLSSVPIHVFFNSLIFSTGYEGGNWRLTIASEAFTDGAEYFPPGAFLWAAGGMFGKYPQGYGNQINMSEYFNPESDEVKNISWTAKSAGSWKRIEAPECVSQYVYCSARTEYRDVVMVVQSHDPSYSFSPNSSLGWSRDSVMAPLSDVEAAYWNPHVPAAQSDSLWFSANCSTSAVIDPRLYRVTGCSQGCYWACGQNDAFIAASSADEIVANYTFNFLLDDWPYPNEQAMHWPGPKGPNASILDLEYCLVQEMQPVCKVGLVNEALLIVIICLVIKTSLCIAVLITFEQHDLLVVLGDAIAAFISQPDDVTKGQCTMDRSGTRVLKFRSSNEPKPQPWHGKSRRWFAAITGARWFWSYLLFAAVLSIAGGLFSSAQKWQPVGGGSQSFDHSLNNGFLITEGFVAAQLFSAVEIANSFQLLVSLLYLVYNALYTRLCAEKEWNSYCTDYRPLRVTSPIGQQISTYRLQLPYRYSIPLIVSSTLLHWLVSSAVYVFILEGGYYQVTTIDFWNPPVLTDPGSGLSDDAFVGVGFSTSALLVVIVVGCVLAVVPLVLCSRRMKDAMVLGGCNSMVISAACHVVPVSGTRPPSPLSVREGGDGYAPVSLCEPTQEARPPSPCSIRDAGDGYDPVPPSEPTQETPPSQEQEAEQGAIEMQNLLELTSTYRDVPSDLGEAEDVKDALIRISRGPVRWGVVRMPPAFYQQYAAVDEAVAHLGFGAAQHDVTEPIEGHWYA